MPHEVAQFKGELKIPEIKIMENKPQSNLDELKCVIKKNFLNQMLKI